LHPEAIPVLPGGSSFLLTGVDHITFELTLFNDGSFHSLSNQNALLTGTDDQGNTYVGNLLQNTVFDGQVGQELTHTLTFPMVSKGAAPNFDVHVTLHFTVNANGTVTSQVADVNATCHGLRTAGCWMRALWSSVDRAFNRTVLGFCAAPERT